jgi:hypothetical protein
LCFFLWNWSWTMTLLPTASHGDRIIGTYHIPRLFVEMGSH